MVRMQVTVTRMVVRLPASGHVRATYMLAGVVSSRRRFMSRALPDVENTLQLV